MMDIVDIFDDGIGEEVNFFVLLGALEHDLGGAEYVAAMDEGNLGREAGEEEGFFHGRIAASNNYDFLAREEEAIARGARGNSVPDELLFMGQAQPASGGAAGDDQRLGMNLVFTKVQQEWTLAEVGAGQVSHAVLGTKALGLFSHVLDELGT